MMLAALEEQARAVSDAALGAFRAAASMAAARSAMAGLVTRTQEAVDANRINLRIAAAQLAVFTRTDESVGMGRAERAVGEIYLKLFSSPNLHIPGYGFQTAREAQFWRDLFTVAPFLGGRR